MKKPHGHISFNMAPATNGGSGGGDGTGKHRLRRPSGEAQPAVTAEMLAAASQPHNTGEVPLEQKFQAVPIVLSKRTLFTLTIPALIGIVGAVSAFTLFYHKVNLHMVNSATHVEAGARSKLQTKVGCEKKAQAVIKAVTVEVKMSQREIQVKQREQIQELGEQLSKKQEARHKELMQQTRATAIETRRARRAAYGR